MNGNLSWVIERAALVHGSREAVVDGPRRYDYAELERRTRGLAAGLARLGAGAGSIVASLAANSHQHFECWLGVPRGGAVLNDLNFRLARPELVFVVDDCGAVALIVDDTHLETGLFLSEKCASVRTVIHTGPGATPDGCIAYESLVAESAELPAVADDALATISYTGGTTGLPKGVMLSHANLVANAKHTLIAIGHRSSDSYLHAAPMFHAADASQNYALTWAGGRHVIIPGFDPDLVTKVIEAERVTLGLFVPTMINMLVNHPATPTRDLSSLRLLMYGASPMPSELQRRAIEMIPCDWTQLYGMTEAAPIVTQCPPEDHARGGKGEEPYATRLRSAGAPVIGVQAEVRRSDGSRADAGEPGEVWVRGPNMMMGYWNRPDETAAALVEDGWYRSGDMAYADVDGYLYMVDRVKDMIISGGENIYSTEVENVLYEHACVLEAAVIGVPDEVWGERVHAVIVLRPGTTASEDDLAAHCRDRIAGYKVPRSLEFRSDPLPKSGAAKILKKDLREPFWAGRERRV
jgi:long-chain acyl-CoA synthetase